MAGDVLLSVPATGSPAWRELYPTPPDVQIPGRWCPIDDTTLRVRLDGWACPVCLAAWDFQGRCGRWLPQLAVAEPATDEPAVAAPAWRLSTVAVLVGIPACAAAAVGLVALLGLLDAGVLAWLSAVIATAGALIPSSMWVARRIADAPYRHNRAVALAAAAVRALPADVRPQLPAAGPARVLPAGTGEVSDGA